MFQKHCVWEVWSVESFNRGMFANVDWEYLENTDGVEGNKLLGWGNQVIEVTYDVYICSYIYILYFGDCRNMPNPGSGSRYNRGKIIITSLLRDLH